MKVDLVVVFTVALFAFWGLWTAWPRQVLALLAAGGAFLVARTAGPALGPAFSLLFDTRAYLGPVISRLMLFLGLFIAARITLFFLARDPQKPGVPPLPPPSGLDRAAGLVFGAVLGGLVAYVAISCVTPAEYELTLLGRRAGFDPDDSVAITQTAKHNAFVLAGDPTAEDNSTNEIRKAPSGQHLPQPEQMFQELERDLDLEPHHPAQKPASR